MQFFEEQRRARVSTHRLVFYFVLAVLGICLSVTFIVYYFYPFFIATDYNPNPTTPLSLILIVNGITLSIIALGTMYKVSQLSSGGHAVAQAMGATPAHVLQGDPLVKRYINIVEEMSIASGVPVPEIYVLNSENGINAFAAGYTMDHAVVAVTRGCLEQLNRDELQGVVAHEFSHILNGDMRLNIRLMGILHGILIIGILGQHLLRIRWSGGSSKNNQGKLLIIAIAIALLVIGYSGFFIGRLIKAAVSREREFLADASAVQFTRNPMGIGGALKKIKDHAYGSFIANENAEEMSHMFFESGIKFSFFGDLFATHPDLDKRMFKIDKSLLNPSYKPKPGPGAGFEKEPPSERPKKIKPSDVIGQNTFQDMFMAQAILEELTSKQLQLDSSLDRSILFLYSVLAVENKDAISKSEVIQDAAEEDLKQIGLALGQMDKRQRVAATEIALSVIKSLDDSKKDKIRTDLLKICLADQKIDIFEMIILITAENALLSEEQLPRSQSKSLMGCKESIRIAMTYISRLSDTASEAFHAGFMEIFMEPGKMATNQDLVLKKVIRAFTELRMIKAEQQKRLVDGFYTLINHDGKITEDETEIFRCILKSMGVPAPPSLAKLSQTSD